MSRKGGTVFTYQARKYTSTVVFQTEPEETETSPVLANMRNRLGYGGAWRFFPALGDYALARLHWIFLSIIVVLWVVMR